MVRNSRNVTNGSHGGLGLEHGSVGGGHVLGGDGIVRGGELGGTAEASGVQYAAGHGTGEGLASSIESEDGLGLGEGLGTLDDVVGGDGSDGRGEGIGNGGSGCDGCAGVDTNEARSGKGRGTGQGEALLHNVEQSRALGPLEGEGNVGLTDGGRDASLAAHVGGGGGCGGLTDGRLGKALLHRSDEGSMVGNAGGAEDGPVENVGILAEGLDGGGRGGVGVVRPPHGRLGAVGGTVQLLGEDGEDVGVGGLGLLPGDGLGVLDVPGLEGAGGGEEGDEAGGLVGGGGVADGGTVPVGGGEGRGTVLLEVAQDEEAGEAGAGLEGQALVGEGGALLGDGLAGGAGVGEGQGDGGGGGGILGDDREAVGEGRYRRRAGLGGGGGRRWNTAIAIAGKEAPKLHEMCVLGEKIHVSIIDTCSGNITS